MISSILDNDLYKFSMGNAVSRLFPRVDARYELINRGGTEFPHGFSENLRWALIGLSNLSLREREKQFLKNHCSFLDPAYIDFIDGYRYDPHEVKIEQDGGDLKVVVEGPWYRTILWEVPLMAVVSELYFNTHREGMLEEAELTARNKGKAAKIRESGIKVADFGTRRRFSFENHKKVVNDFGDALIGTSNVYLAMIYNLIPIGTQAHEWFMFHAAKYGYKMANKIAMDNWVRVFRGDLGIALSDTYTTEAFLPSFDKKLAKLFDGVRQDSGEPTEVLEVFIKHYKSLGIDPSTKAIIFSDGLDVEKASKLHVYCNGRMRDAYGIGTNLSNDVGVRPLNFVVKLTGVNFGSGWMPTVKLSDSPGKHTGCKDEVELCQRTLGLNGS
jgi:nicotinate phosphoribosyltransferase